MKSSVPLNMLRVYVRIVVDNKLANHSQALKHAVKALDSHVKDIVSHKCTRCGFETREIF